MKEQLSGQGKISVFLFPAANHLEEAWSTMSQLWNNESTWQQRVEDYAVAQLLETKNDYWLADDESELTPEQFKARMTLEDITIETGGEFVFWHNDGDLFFGHHIMIAGNLNDGLIDADIPG